MNKSTKILLFSLLGLLLVGISIFLLVCFLQKDVFTEKSYIVATDSTKIDTIDIQVADRELDIRATTGNQIHIDYFDGTKEYLDITISQSGTLTIKLINNKSWTDYIRLKPDATYRKITIQIPNNLVVNCAAKTTDADIKISALSFQKLDLNTNGGNIFCERVDVQTSIGLTTKNGNITGSVIGGWDDFKISCTIKKGRCNLPLNKAEGTKALSANCNNGDINIQFVA